MDKIKRLVCLTASCLLGNYGYAAEKQPPLQQVQQYLDSVEVSFTHYWDSRNYNTITTQYSMKLPFQLSVWGFVDRESRGNDDIYDYSQYFTENRLTRMFNKNFGVQIENNDKRGANNSLLRVGLLYKTVWRDNFFILRAFPLETDGDGAQLSFVWNVPVIKETLFFEGFIDYNIHENAEDRVVFEPQLRWMLHKHWGVVIEGRYNEYLKNSKYDDIGIGLGINFRF